uniref:uncharacterized protein LOC122604663 n=1 Tax=Erigeron canadensis TaxID=72917 RepID=UPI001CB8BBDC|nr:uncharacterized protein LOC122604663 [Erigeron canadensis]
MSTRRGNRAYDKLINESSTNEPKMLRSMTLPTNFFDEFPVKFVVEPKVPSKVNKFVEKEAKKASKVHPFFSLFERKNRKKKATAKPEFSRYMQYLKEAGSWNDNSAKPVIY